MKKILFICTGNTCRSPMAEGFMKAVLTEDSKLSAEFCTSSAGISAYPGDHASSHSIDAMLSEWKIDISEHIAAALDEEEVADAFLILTMTGRQKEYLLAEYPEAVGKTYTLKEFTDSRHTLTGNLPDYRYSLDITDPYGGPLQIYSKCAGEIKEAVNRLIDILKKS